MFDYYIKKNIDFDFKGTKISINTRKQNLSIDDTKNIAMNPTYNDRILEAFREEKIFLPCKKELVKDYDKTPIYLSSRSIMKRNIKNTEFYLDFLAYNDNGNILPGKAVNRSLGHKNDIAEFEVHQILLGKVFSIFIGEGNKIYYGVFQEGDYFEVPAGWFHCTYIISGPAVVANFYCNAFWASDYAKKPYFGLKNNISINNVNEGLMLVTEQMKITLEQLQKDKIVESKDNIFMPYGDIKELLLIKDYKSVEQNIFNLFNSDSLKEIVESSLYSK